MIEISQIRTDGGTQARASINDDTVAEYAEAMADPNTVFPPLTVYFDGRSYWLADGFHRLAAWQRLGRKEAPADVRHGDRRRAILHSVAANSAHGLRRTNDDKRHAVLTLLEDAEWSMWSDREIARQCAVSAPFVGKVRAELSVNGLQIEAPRVVHRGKTIYTQNTTRIGKNKSCAEVEQLSSLPGGSHELPDGQPGAPNRQRDPHALARKALSGKTREELENEVIGLRSDNATLRLKAKALMDKLVEFSGGKALLVRPQQSRVKKQEKNDNEATKSVP